MIVVTVTLHSARTGKVTLLGRMLLSNDGTSKDKNIGNYNAEVLRKNSSKVARRGTVPEFPRKSYNIWRLVSRALRSAFPEEQ